MVEIRGTVVTITEKYNIIRISEDEAEQLSKQEHIDGELVLVNDRKIKTVCAYGEVEPAEVAQGEVKLSTVLKKIIPYENYYRNKQWVKVFRCFAGKDIVQGMIIHEDVGSSINCLMSILKDPVYVLIFRY